MKTSQTTDYIINFTKIKLFHFLGSLSDHWWGQNRWWTIDKGWKSSIRYFHDIINKKIVNVVVVTLGKAGEACKAFTWRPDKGNSCWLKSDWTATKERESDSATWSGLRCDLQQKSLTPSRDPDGVSDPRARSVFEISANWLQAKMWLVVGFPIPRKESQSHGKKQS